MNTDAPVWRVTYGHPNHPRPYYVEPTSARLCEWEDVIREGLTRQEALALADLLTIGEQDGS